MCFYFWKLAAISASSVYEIQSALSTKLLGVQWGGFMGLFQIQKRTAFGDVMVSMVTLANNTVLYI